MIFVLSVIRYILYILRLKVRYKFIIRVFDETGFLVGYDWECSIQISISHNSWRGFVSPQFLLYKISKFSVVNALQFTNR